ncbi:MAG TPA: M48 family metalloprotease [Candidatus Ozemobacteraceae bacterium]|nr:M48 family metalloprotease [Candidatus Ozemobacteraceae bacterium]
MKRFAMTAALGASLLFGIPSVSEAGNILGNLLKVYQTYEQANMMLWLTGDTKAEKRVGGEMKWFINLTNKKVKDPETNRWVRSVFDRIKPQFRDRGFDYNVTILNDNTVNAFAIPGGSIFVYKGMLDFVGSDDELAAVLAHEMAHSERRHSLKQLRQSTAFQLLLQKAVKSGRDRDTWGQVVGAVTMLKFSRDDEYEADEIGQTRLTKAGYNPAGQVVLWEKFVQKFGKGEKGIMQYLSTHPPSQDRVEKAKSRLVSLAPGSSATLSSARGVPTAQLVAGDLTLSFNILSDTSENLLQNSSFETDLAKKGLPDAWTVKEGKAVFDTGSAMTGRGSLCLEPESHLRPVRVVSELIAVNPAEKYELSGWIRSSDGAAKASIGAEVYDKAKRLRGFIWPVLSGALVPSSWQHVEGLFTGGSSATVSLPKDAAFIRVLLQNGPLSRGQVWLDDLTVRRAAAPKAVNLVDNGDFEYDGGNGIPRGVVAPAGQASRDFDHPKTGYASLRIIGNDGGETTAELAPIPVSTLKDGQQLQGSFQFNGSGEIRARLLIELLDDAGNPLTRRLVERGFTTKPNLWQATGFKATYLLQPEEKNVVKSIGIKFAGSIPATASLWLDSVIVR